MSQILRYLGFLCLGKGGRLRGFLDAKTAKEAKMHEEIRRAGGLKGMDFVRQLWKDKAQKLGVCR